MQEALSTLNLLVKLANFWIQSHIATITPRH